MERADIAIVGGGFAGLATAARAVELGLKPVVLEKGLDADYLCNSRVSGGFVHIALRDPTDPAAELSETIGSITGGFADKELAGMIASQGSRLIEWLRGKGVKFIRVGARPVGHFVMAPPRTVQSGLSWKGRGPDGLIRLLTRSIDVGGGEIRLGSKARNLIMADGKCVGVEFERNGEVGEIAAAAIMIADGGFQANQELLRQFITSKPEQLQQRNARSGTGDGLSMARNVGAKIVGTDCFYGHVLSRDAFTDDRLWPYPQLDSVAVSGIVVDKSGRRIVDEGLGGTYMANALARRDNPADAVAIFDNDVWEGPAADMSNPPATNPTLKIHNATMFTANSVAELAARAGLPADALSETVSGYNDALKSDRLEQLQPPRTVKGGQHLAVKRPYGIARPPFFAVPLCPGITYTMGGIAVDADARVLDTAGQPIAGLFAAGATTGGLEGGPTVGYVGGISKALILGIKAAECVARDR